MMPDVGDIDSDLRLAGTTRTKVEAEIAALLADLRTLDLTVDSLLELRMRTHVGD